ncbi:DoxX family protein [Alteromonas sediminis]|uniref:DoxX family protein n=1 Tax=Alteromonas sediminis TaxID=2259342 RepID=A0A3N5Z974_9ALTE|nr:DoxX family protein [Alteromonas sediminis]RPJ67534.1 DoxX family protein [Alteromonas sediminis]
MFNRIRSFHNSTTLLVDYLQSPALLAARVYVAWVFFKSGLTKLNDWDSTLMLFEYEYEVPFLDHMTAAYLATGGELLLPVLFALGLLSRFSAAGLFIINWVAVISLVDMPQAAFNLHLIWAGLTGLVFAWGGGFLSVDKKLKLN